MHPADGFRPFSPPPFRPLTSPTPELQRLIATAKASLDAARARLNELKADPTLTEPARAVAVTAALALVVKLNRIYMATVQGTVSNGAA